MEFGWYHEFHRQVEGQSDADAFEQGFEQVEAADRWGLDVFWLAEIHQQARRSVLSAPMNVAGQIAARTKRIKIGTAVHVLPLNHPLRLAEETATVDQVSRGRRVETAGRFVEEDDARTAEDFGSDVRSLALASTERVHGSVATG